jgi:hypothetical protein
MNFPEGVLRAPLIRMFAKYEILRARRGGGLFDYLLDTSH